MNSRRTSFFGFMLWICLMIKRSLQVEIFPSGKHLSGPVHTLPSLQFPDTSECKRFPHPSSADEKRRLTGGASCQASLLADSRLGAVLIPSDRWSNVPLNLRC